MEAKSLSRATVASVALRMIPPSIEQTLLGDSTFCAEFDIEADTTVEFGGAGVSFRRTELFEAIRNVRSKHSSFRPLKDVSGDAWRLYFRVSSAGPSLRLARRKKRLELPAYFLLLRSERAIRRSGLTREVAKFRLDRDSVRYWEEITSTRALSDSEVFGFTDDIANTPVSAAVRIRDSISLGKSGIETLVPRHRNYYERLVGPSEPDASLLDWIRYTKGAWTSELMGWSPKEGLMQLLLRSSHSQLVPDLVNGQIEEDGIAEVFDDLIRYGDLLSQIGAIEFGLAHLEAWPSLSGKIVALLNQAFPADEEEAERRYLLLSSAFAMVDAEIGRLGLFRREPPYYRRCASLAQASLIERAVRQSKVRAENFARFCFDIGSQAFWLLTLLDQRTAPYWSSEMASWQQLRQECLGRVLTTASTCEKSVRAEELRRLLFDKGSSHIHRSWEMLLSILPGPLEGQVEKPVGMPEPIRSRLEQELAEEMPSYQSFIALGNVAYFFPIPCDLSALAVSAIRRCERLVSSDEDFDRLAPALVSLARVAAITRDRDLAEEVRSSMHRHRYMKSDSIEMQSAITIGLTACAAFEAKGTWIRRVGECLSQLAFDELTAESAKWLCTSLDITLEMDDELWSTCARARAAAESALELSQRRREP